MKRIPAFSQPAFSHFCFFWMPSMLSLGHHWNGVNGFGMNDEAERVILARRP